MLNCFLYFLIETTFDKVNNALDYYMRVISYAETRRQSGEFRSRGRYSHALTLLTFLNSDGIAGVVFVHYFYVSFPGSLTGADYVHNNLYVRTPSSCLIFKWATEFFRQRWQPRKKRPQYKTTMQILTLE